MNILKDDLSIGKSVIALIFLLFPNISPNAGFDSKSIQKPAVLLYRYVPSFVRGVRPLQPAVAQPECKQTDSYAFEEKPLDSVFLHAAEEKQCSFFQWIKTVCKTHESSQTIYTSSEIGSPTCYQDPFDPLSLPKHAGSPRESWPAFFHWLRFRHRPGTVPSVSWLLLKKRNRNHFQEQKTRSVPASVHRKQEEMMSFGCSLP